MVLLSKEFQGRLAESACSNFMHPFTNSCFLALFKNQLESISKLINFFSAMYFAQMLISKKSLSKLRVDEILKGFIQSVIMGVTQVTIFSSVICIQWNLFKRYSYLFTGYGLGSLLGSTIFLSPSFRRPIESSTFSIMAIEYILKSLSLGGYLPKSHKAGALLFMTCNAVTMYLLWIKSHKKTNISLSWLFTPSVRQNIPKGIICSHEGTCVQDFIKVCTKYFSIGLGINVAKLLVTYMANRKGGDLNYMLKLSHLKLPIFFAVYVGLYKLSNCGLNRVKGKESGNNALLSGFLAGSAYLIKPTPSIPATMLALLSMCVWAELKKAKKVPILPYQELANIISNAILIDGLICRKKMVPKFYTNLLQYVVGKRLVEEVTSIRLK